MTAPQVGRPSNDERAPRRVRGIVILDLETEDTVEGALVCWRLLAEQIVEDCPSLYAFVRPDDDPLPANDGLSERQFHLGAAIEYMEWEVNDGVPLRPTHVQRLKRILSGGVLDPDDSVLGHLRIPADPDDR